MRRYVAMGLAFVMSVAIAVPTVAQQPAASAKPAASASAKTAASAAPAAAAPAAAAKGADAGAAPTTASSAGAGSPTPMAPSTAPAAASSAAPGQMDGATYTVRLRDLEARVDELKDQIRRSHTRLALLSDTIMSGGVGGSRAEIAFHNEMSSAFKLVRAVVVLDGAVQYNRQDDTGALADQKDIPVFTGSVPPGDHTVSTLLVFQGNGYGVFTYLRGYKFEVKSAHSFTAVEGKAMTITATALEKGGVTTPLEQRPQVDWKEKVQSLGGTAPAAAPTPAPAGGASGGVTTGNNGGSAGLSVGGGTK